MNRTQANSLRLNSVIQNIYTNKKAAVVEMWYSEICDEEKRFKIKYYDGRVEDALDYYNLKDFDAVGNDKLAESL